MKAVRVVLVAVAATVSVGCSSGSGDGDGGAASCAYVVEYENRTYLGRGETDIPVEDVLGTATKPACDDTPDDDSDGETAPTSLTAYAVQGVDPSVAIAVGEAPGDVRLALVDTLKKLPPEVKKVIDAS
jgi:hypothetical protein